MCANHILQSEYLMWMLQDDYSGLNGNRVGRKTATDAHTGRTPVIGCLMSLSLRLVV